MPPQPQAAESDRPRWIPGEPYRPLTFYQAGLLRGYADPDNTAARHECERRETQEEADGLACPDPDCAAPTGTRCFGPDARSNHPVRAMAHWSACTRARAA